MSWGVPEIPDHMFALSRRRLLAAALAATVTVTVPSARVARAADDRKLRKLIRAAEMIAYSTFTPVEDFTYSDVRTRQNVSVRRDLAGHVVLVNAWATWCPPCVREMAALQEIYAAFKEKGFVVLAINILDRASNVEVGAWADGRGITFPILRGGKWDDMPMMRRRRIPQTFLIDQKSRLIATRDGEFAWADESVKNLVGYLVSDGA